MHAESATDWRARAVAKMGEIAMSAITVWPSLYEPAKGLRFPLDALLARVQSPRSYAGKHAVPRWSSAIYRDNYRDRAHFVSEAMIVTDVGDHGPVSRGQVESVFACLLGFAYSSWSSVPMSPRWRPHCCSRVPSRPTSTIASSGTSSSSKSAPASAPDRNSKDARHTLGRSSPRAPATNTSTSPAILSTSPWRWRGSRRREPLPIVQRELDESYDRRLDRVRGTWPRCQCDLREWWTRSHVQSGVRVRPRLRDRAGRRARLARQRIQPAMRASVERSRAPTQDPASAQRAPTARLSRREGRAP